MRRVLALVLLVLSAGWLVGCNDDPQPADGTALRPSGGKVERLAAKDGRIVDSRGKAVVLRGVNAFAGIENGEGLPQAEFERIADAGFNVVRLVANWDTIEPRAPQNGRRTYDERALKALDTAIQRAGDAGLYVVLSPLHLYMVSPAFGGRGIPEWVYKPRGYDLNRAQAEVAKDRYMHDNLYPFLDLIGKRYAGNPVVAAIDPVNEPPAAPQDDILTWYREIIGRMREAAPGTMVIVEPRFGDHNLSMSDMGRLGDPRNLVISPHLYYAGGSGDGYAPDGSKAGRFLFDGKSDYRGDAKDDLAEHLQKTLDAAKSIGAPVWVGEFGIGREEARAQEFVRDMTEVMGEKGLGWAYWVHSSQDSFSLTDTARGRYGPLAEPLSAAARAGR